MNVEYKYKGTESIYPFIIAQKQIKTCAQKAGKLASLWN